MPDFDPKLTPATNLHIDSKATQPGNTVLQHGGAAATPLSALEQAVQTLQTQVTAMLVSDASVKAANSALTDRVAELEKGMFEVKFAMQGVQPGIDTVNATLSGKIDGLRADFTSHTHDLPFEYESWAFFENQPDNAKPLYMVPYFGDNQPGATQVTRETAALAQNHTAAPASKQGS